MTYDVFNDVRDAAPAVEPPTELQFARQRRLLAGAMAELADTRPVSHDTSEQSTAAHILDGRRHLRRSLAGGIAAAALVAAGVGIVSTGSSTRSPQVATTHPASRTHTILYQLASASIDDPALVGRYVVLSETDTETGYPGTSQRTTVIDTETGASTTYQQPYAGTNAPSVLTAGPDASSTEAWFTALPTDPVALRAQLLTIAEQQQAQFEQNSEGLAATAGTARAVPIIQRALSDDDLVYEEANDLLWSPLVQPALRSALYKVLATTSGFTLDPDATDPSGRPAIAMVRHWNGTDETDTTYEDPQTGMVLAQVWNSTVIGTITAVYQPATSSDTVPPNPYAG